MRITGGEHRGRRLRAPAQDVRPTQEMVREALFSMLGNDLEGERFLDLFAGTGAVGLDAVSRGAEFVCWVEQSRDVRRVLESNVSSLGDAPGRVVADDAVAYVKRWRGTIPYSLIFADPPYFASRGRPRAWLDELLDGILASGILAPGGLFVFESASRGHGVARDLPEPAGWHLVEERTYGRARLAFYRQETTA